MNNQIRALAEQAGIDNIRWVKGIGCHSVVSPELAKFAELIVEECIAICQDTDGEDNIDARSGRQDCAVEIREHFGVEEWSPG